MAKSEDKDEDVLHDKPSNDRRFNWRNAGVGGGVASLLSILAFIKPQIDKALDNSHKETYYTETIAQQTNEQQRSNQLIEQLQKTLKFMRLDQVRARRIAQADRDEQTHKINQIIQQNEEEKKAAALVKKQLEAGQTAATLALKKCEEDCKPTLKRKKL